MSAQVRSRLLSIGRIGCSSLFFALAVGQPLPAGWEAKQDPGSGKTYYVNHETKATQWTRPQYQVAGKVGRRGSGLGKLPAGWEMKHTAEGKPYFVNHATKKTQWTMPNA